MPSSYSISSMAAVREKQLLVDVKGCIIRLNRPVNTQMVVDALTQAGNKQGKTGVQKALDFLVETKDIIEKTYGKAKIYYPDQSKMPEAPPEELRRMEQTSAELRQSVATEAASVSSLDFTLRKLNQRTNVADAKAELATLEKELPELEKRLAAAKAASGGVTPQEQEELSKKYDTYVSSWRQRKKVCMNAVNQIYENCDKPKKDLMAAMGLDLNDDVEVMLPSIRWEGTVNLIGSFTMRISSLPFAEEPLDFEKIARTRSGATVILWANFTEEIILRLTYEILQLALYPNIIAGMPAFLANRLATD